MTDELDKLSDAELSEVFAVEVAGWVRNVISGKPSGHPWMPEPPPFSTSLDALLPHMEQQRLSILRVGYGPAQWLVYSQNPVIGEVRHASLARAICVVLILVSRAEMDEDKARHRSEHPLGTEGGPNENLAPNFP